MKKIFSLGVLAMLPILLHAQTDYRNLFRLGFGLTHFKAKDFKFVEPYIAFTYERRAGKFAIGAYLAAGEFAGYTEDLAFNYYYVTKETGTFEVVGARADYFFLSKGHLELYGGVNCGLAAIDGLYKDQYYIWNDPVYNGTRGKHDASDADGLHVGAQIGAYYWIREHFGVWGEVNIGSSVFNLGVALNR